MTVVSARLGESKVADTRKFVTFGGCKGPAAAMAGPGAIVINRTRDKPYKLCD